MQFVKSDSERDHENLFKTLFFRYIPYWPLFLLLLLAAAGGAYLYLKYSTPQYEAKARLLIKDEKKGSEDAKTMEVFNALSTKKISENEIEVIQSRDLMDEVVHDLHLYAPVFEETSFRSKMLYRNSPLQIILQNPDRLAEARKVYFTLNADGQAVTIAGKKYPANQWVNAGFGLVKFVPANTGNSLPPGKMYFTLDPIADVSANLLTNLKVSSPSKMSSIMELKLRDPVPQRGEDILNELVAAYERSVIKDKNTLAANTMRFLDTRLERVEKELDQIETSIQQYKSRTEAVDVGTQGKLFLQNVSTNDQRLGEINIQLSVLEQVEKYVQANGSASSIPSTIGITDPVLSTMVDKLYNAELEYERLKKTTAENNPMLASLDDQIRKIKPGIIDNIRNQRLNLVATRNNLAVNNRAYSSALQAIPEKEKELIEINRQQNVKNSLYSLLLQKREETALSYASSVADSRMIEKARASLVPVKPRPKVIYLFSLLAAMVAGMSFVSLKELFTRKILFRQEIEKLTKAPVIGEIIAEKTKNPIVIDADKKTFIAEQFRKLRMALGYIGVNAKNNRILVTSTVSGEGKSFVAANLAVSLALTGKKVVLVDLDLNNPSINRKLNMSPDTGVSDFLLGHRDVDEIISPTDINENLFYIPTGELPGRPSETIMNGKAEVLLNYLSSHFDYVVVDSAPVGPVTDAYLLSPYCDATLFVIRHGYTPKVFIERLDENNKINNLTNVAIVFNGVMGRGLGTRQYGYGYGYGYIYPNKEVPKRKRNRLRVN